MKSNLKNDCPTKYHNKNNIKFQEQKSYFMIGVCVYIYIYQTNKQTRGYDF